MNASTKIGDFKNVGNWVNTLNSENMPTVITVNNFSNVVNTLSNDNNVNLWHTFKPNFYYTRSEKPYSWI